MKSASTGARSMRPWVLCREFDFILMAPEAFRMVTLEF